MRYYLSIFMVAREIFGYRIYLFGLIAGLANTALISIINIAIQYGTYNRVYPTYLFAAYLSALILYFSLQYYFQALLINTAEMLILKSRMELVNRIRFCSLRNFEEAGSNKLFILLAQDTNAIGQIASLTSGTMLSVVVIMGTLTYLAVLSIKGFILTLLIICIALYIAFSKQKINIRRIRHVIELENKFLSYVRSLLFGIKEVKTDSSVNKELHNRHLKPVMEQVSMEKTWNAVYQSRFALLGQGIFFVSIGLILFVFPMIDFNITRNPAQFVIGLLYVLAPIQTLIPLIPQYAFVKATLERIEAAKAVLKAELPETPPENPGNPAEFKHIQLQQLSFTYNDFPNEDSFCLGPINLRINAGDLLFIHGGNGAGKSTLIKLISGLYPAKNGSIRLNGNTVTQENIQDYRDLFGVIFTDNHLFDFIYGIGDISLEEINKLIARMGLSGKITYNMEGFDTIDVSEGQKKRLALVSTIIKNKPVYIFDEWAANQDPPFRHFFYTSLIPELNKMGSTIIIITHDDRYLHLAKRILRMEDGQLLEIKQP
ncbi:MAG: cyclic peptide export ABC transporter [Bacteroidetes bacterium]|nr:cyclic peptide export ABC transporter [Bacteroidota bacterium]